MSALALAMVLVADTGDERCGVLQAVPPGNVLGDADATGGGSSPGRRLPPERAATRL